MSVRAVAAVGVMLSGLLLSAAASIAGATSEPVPLAHWSFDEGTGSTAADSGVHGANLGLSGASWVADGHAGSALHLEDSSVGGLATNLHVENLTVTLWVRGDPDHPPADGAAIVELGGRGGCEASTWGLYAKGSSFEFGWKDAGTGGTYRAGGYQVEGHALWDGEWHLISVATSTATGAEIYQAIDQFASGFNYAAPKFDYDTIDLDGISVGGGAGNCETPPDFRGDVDDLRIYDATLTPDQIGGLMAPVETGTLLVGPETDPLAGETICFHATISPVPGGRGTSLRFTPSDAEATTYDMFFQSLGLMYFCTSRPAGDYTVQANFDGMRPWISSSSNVIDLHVEKRVSSVIVGGSSQQLTSEPLHVGAAVDGHGLMVTGSVDLYEIVRDERVFLGSHALTWGGQYSGASIDLPARPAGTYTFEAEYAGDPNHTAATTGSGEIVVTQDVVPGVVTINGGEAATSNPIVTVSTSAVGARSVVVSNGTVFKIFDPYQASVVGWNLNDPAYGGWNGDGVKTVHVRWYNAFNKMTDEATASIILDRSAPVAGAPTSAPASGATVDSSVVPIRFGWAVSAAPSGADHFLWSQQTDGGPWSTPSTVSAPALKRLLVSGHTYRVAVKPIDRAGNVGAWAYGSTFRVTGVQQSAGSVHYAGTWATSTSITWWGGTARSSSKAGSTVSYTFTGKSIGWVSLKAANRGRAAIYVNGVLKATVDLYSATTKKQLVVWSANYSTSATRTVTIKVLGTTSRPRVDIDGFIVGS
ncbi:MAG TPA: LamG-like jellyroll fold domain-containing protein [Candidatus Limnocylindrales bacterium]|nr:LamG-like jellyroll fold domain-containing protein [Candidatus Limnocylindrales bacterium]